MSDEEWTWQLRTPAKRTYDNLDTQARSRNRLDEIVTDRWRDPDEHLEPLTGVPHSKLRIGSFRLGAECNHDEHTLDMDTIERRGGAYKPGDDESGLPQTYIMSAIMALYVGYRYK